MNSVVLGKIINWCTYHNEPYLENDFKEATYLSADNNQTIQISEWDKEFLRVDDQTLVDIILAADFLDIKDLLETACKTVALMIKNKTPSEIRNRFNIRDPFEEAFKENKKVLSFFTFHK